MSQNTQQYLNNLINKSRIYYLDLNNSPQRQNHDCSTCRQRVNSFCKNCDTERQLERDRRFKSIWKFKRDQCF